MSLLLGLALATGILLAISPRLWPNRGHFSVANRRFNSRLRVMLNQAHLTSLGVGGLICAMIAIAFVSAAITFLVLPVVGLVIVVAVAASTVPLVVVRHRARTNQRNSRQAWPDVIDQLVSAVRSGMSLPESVGSLAHVGPEATRLDFAQFKADYDATGNFDRSVVALKSRLADPVADRLLETLRMARKVGGTELPNLLRTLSASLRQEIAIRGEIEARQSWIVNAARIGAIAPWIILGLLATRPQAIAAYNSVSGLAVILGGVVVTVIAYYAMIAIARIPQERRWFG
ncbi:MAG: type II secretion system F family protein [Cryobacterium sp.]|nr:type II secretion system F family protein [Cryobacterium sp.]